MRYNTVRRYVCDSAATATAALSRDMKSRLPIYMPFMFCRIISSVLFQAQSQQD